MTKVAITEQYLTDIADAIRAKSGTSGGMTPADMASAVADIPSGGGSSGLALNIIIKNSGSTYRLDKTVSEIVEALNSGISPVFISTDSDGLKNYYQLKSVAFTPSTWYIRILCTGYADEFRATGASAYPSFTKSGGGGNND